MSYVKGKSLEPSSGIVGFAKKKGSVENPARGILGGDLPGEKFTKCLHINKIQNTLKMYL